MCGITGWVAFDRDLRAQEGVLRTMTGTMALRGPDAEGFWLDEHVALGHRRLSVIDIAGGVQPMASETAVLTYSGEVYNFADLRAELASLGHRFRTSSDTEVVLRGYLQWGERVVDRLNGMYAFAVWDARYERLLLVRDRLGIKPLYYFPTEDGVLFGSEPKAILAHPLAERVVDLDGLRDLFSYLKTPGSCVWRGMREVAPGEAVRVDRTGLRRSRYWQLEAREHVDDLGTTVSTVRELLTDVVSRQLVSDVPLCALLSGGLDSSALVALAGPVRSFAVDFDGYADKFVADGWRSVPDQPFAREVAAHVGTPHLEIRLSTSDLIAPWLREAVLTACDAPAPTADGHWSLYLLFRALRQHSTVALSGEGADEVFGGYGHSHDQQAVHADTFSWLVRFGEMIRNRRSLLHPDLLAELDLPAYVADQYATALAEVPHVGTDPLERRMREECYLNLTRFLPILLERKDRLSMASGLEVRVPFCDHRLVEYVFGTPWSMKTFDGREKSLLRAAVTDLLPDSVVWRRKSPYPSTQDASYELALREELAKVVARGGRGTELLDTTRVAALLAEPPALVSSAESRFPLERALVFTGWLELTEAVL